MYTVARKCRDFSPGAMGQRAARRPSELLSALGASARGGRPRSIRPPVMAFSGVDWHQVTGMTPEAAEHAPTKFKKRCNLHKSGSERDSRGASERLSRGRPRARPIRFRLSRAPTATRTGPSRRSGVGFQRVIRSSSSTKRFLGYRTTVRARGSCACGHSARDAVTPTRTRRTLNTLRAAA